MNHCYAATYYTICIVLLHYLLTSKNEPAPPVLAREAYAFYTWHLETGAASPQSTTALTITVWPLSICSYYYYYKKKVHSGICIIFVAPY